MIEVNNKKCIFFDLDGVLIDSRCLHFLAFKEALELSGIKISHEEHVSRFDGLPTAQKLMVLKNEFQLSEEIVKIIEDYKQKRTLELIEQSIKVDEEYINLLNLLSLKFSLYICSNSKLQTIIQISKKLKIDTYFKAFLSQENVSMPKPSPLIYLEAQKLSGFKASECLIIEDSPHGVKAASDSGIDFFEVSNSLEAKKLIAKFL